MMLKDQIAVVTGATRGIGRATLERFAAEGATVIGIYAKSDDVASHLQDEMNRRGLSVQLYKGSVTDPVFIRELVHEVKMRYGRIDVLVNNAGITADSLALMMSPEQWDQVFHTNFIGTLLCAEAVIPIMEERNNGRVINVGSVSGVYGREAQINYSTSKGAIIGLTKMLARRHAPKHIIINAIAPGMIATEMTDRIPDAKLENFLHHTNTNRLGTVEEIANLIVWLAGGQSSYISGQVIRVDGGFLR